MVQNEKRQIKTELCVVIKAVTLMAFSYLHTTNTAKEKKTTEAPLVSAAPWSNVATLQRLVLMVH